MKPAGALALKPAGALPLTGPQVCVRRLRGSDLPVFQAYRNDAEVGRYQGWLPMADAEAAAFINGMAATPFCPPGAWCQLALANAQDDSLVGDIGLHLAADGSHAELGYTLARAAQGRGWATEAVRLAVAAVFAHTPAQRVVALTDVRNTASLRLLQRLRFRPVATLDAVFRGEPCQEQHFVQHRPGRPAPVLRAALAEDAHAVAQVLIDSRRVLMPFAPSAHTEDEIHRWVASQLLPAGGVTVATAGGTVAGVLATSLQGGVGWVEQLYVHPAHAGAGLGRALLQHALAELPRPLRLYTFQANLHARAFYEGQGFVALSFGDGAGNEEQCPDVLYERAA